MKKKTTRMVRPIKVSLKESLKILVSRVASIPLKIVIREASTVVRTRQGRRQKLIAAEMHSTLVQLRTWQEAISGTKPSATDYISPKTTRLETEKGQTSAHFEPIFKTIIFL
jgi:hypothetical protein